ncbi:unnamed protein product, partial [marine sediment metagenome]
HVQFTFTAPPPPSHILSVDTTPISGVPFTIKEGIEVSYASPWSGSLEEVTYQIAMPDTVTDGEETYKFVSWEDGSTSRVRNVDLTTDIAITATYEVAPPPKPLCFIATAAYGSPFASELNVLKQFRDQCLPDKLVHVYYKTGPYLAQFIKSRKAIKRYVRTALNLFVKMIKCQQ